MRSGGQSIFFYRLREFTRSSGTCVIIRRQLFAASSHRRSSKCHNVEERCVSERDRETMAVYPTPSHRRLIVFYRLCGYTPRKIVVLSPARSQGFHPPVDNRAWPLRVPTRETRIHLSYRDSSRHGNPSFPSLNSGGSLARRHPNWRFLQTQTLTSYPSQRIPPSKATKSPP